MADSYVHLIGADEVRKAGYQIDEAMTTFARYVGSFESSVGDLTRALNDHTEALNNHTQIMEKLIEKLPNDNTIS